MDLLEVKQMVKRSPSTKIISKIQSPEALKNIDEIIDACDGIMLSRNCLANFMLDVYNSDV
jgi:pyruvate kinase